MKHELENDRLLEEHDLSIEPASPDVRRVLTRSNAIWYAACIATLVAVFLAGIGIAFAIKSHGTDSTQPPPVSDNANGHWVATWAAAAQGASAERALPSDHVRSGVSLSRNSIWTWLWKLPLLEPVTMFLEDTTLRQTHRMSIGAEEIRIRLTNVYTPVQLPIEKVVIALAEPEHSRTGQTSPIGSSKILVNTSRTMTFAGRESIVIPPYGVAVSDPLEFRIEADQTITLNYYLKYGQAADTITTHLVSKTTSWLLKGDYTNEHDFRKAGGGSTPHWYFTSAVEAWKPLEYGALVTLGDSITDRGSDDTNTDYRWPNFLSTRMQASNDPSVNSVSVVNHALGGNRVAKEGKGSNLISRLDRDVLAVSGVRYVMLLEGILDIGFAGQNATTQQLAVEDLKQQYRQVVTRCHTAGISVFASTLTPMSCNLRNGTGSSDAPEEEASRLAVNEWLLNEGPFDAIVDFDQAIRDPRNHTTQDPEYISHDCIHPNPAGLQAMADAFPLDLFGRFRDGVDPHER